jgi:hypothetical protein
MLDQTPRDIHGYPLPHCEACYLHGDCELIGVSLTNGHLTLCKRCLDELRNPGKYIGDAEESARHEKAADIRP